MKTLRNRNLYAAGIPSMFRRGSRATALRVEARARGFIGEESRYRLIETNRSPIVEALKGEYAAYTTQEAKDRAKRIIGLTIAATFALM